MSRITPSVGRKVWFYEHEGQVEPIDATVVKVHGGAATAHPDSLVNLDTVDPDTGMHMLRSSVRVGDENTPHWHYRWMDWQQTTLNPAGRDAFT